MGDYTGINGDTHSGAGIDDLLTSEAMPDLANEMRAALEDTMAKVGVIDQLARAGTPFDNQIQMGINEPNVSGAIRALSAQTEILEQVITGLNVTTGDLRQDTEEDHLGNCRTTTLVLCDSTGTCYGIRGECVEQGLFLCEGCPLALPG